MTKSRKKLKCLCNDDHMCPLYDVKPGEKRQCVTDSVCITKRYRHLDDKNTEYLKYSCDHFFQNSIREVVVEYRDCLINSTNKHDSDWVKEYSAEYCCDSEDFCNEFLNPQNAVSINPPDSSDSLSHITGPKSIGQNIDVFTTINIIFLSFLSFFALLVFSIILLCLIRRWRKVKKQKGKASNHLSSLSSGSSGASTTSSSKSKSTTVSNNTTATNLHSQIDEKCDHLIPAQIHLHTNYNYPTKNANSHLILKQNEYLNNNVQHQIIEEAELLQPLIDTKALPAKIISENSNPLTLGSDFCTTSECYTTDMSSSGQNGNNNIYSTQSSNVTNSNDFEWSGSGSGAGVPELLQRTIARQIKLIFPCIGKGRFGEVYKGLWRDELVAVKTFNSADEKSWKNECQIYNTSGFRHENILGFIASDNIDRGTYTELWIITEFHHNGSLYDYLNQPSLKQTAKDTLRMALSIVNGLDHLHTAIESCTGKPSLAHCDLKSKNVLVKADLTCCISDLGLALCGDKNGFVTQNPATIRTGTKRYMAPEILAKTINYKSLLQFQNAEMYSLALIFWELLRRTSFEIAPVSYSYDYKLPYYEHVQSDPDEIQMKQLVCDEKIRPEINNLWRQIPILNELTELTEELWVENANGRLNALRLKKSINQIKRKFV